jgi:hypothetical protein
MRVMRSVIALLSTYVLALMLAGSFPVGTDNAAHKGDLLHWVLPHVHLDAVGHGSLAQPVFNDHHSGGGALGAGADGAAAGGGVALMPPVPTRASSILISSNDAWPFELSSERRPRDWSGPRPERPPTPRV